MNPELRQTIQRVTRNIESANETAQENIYTFSQNYVDPCLASIRGCLIGCGESCFPNPAEARKRKRARESRSRGRAELNFDFYDDWDDEFGEEEETDALLGWGNERLDRLLAGNQQARSNHGGLTVDPKQPRRQRGMSYGSRGGRRHGLPQESGQDPTVIPSSSYFGFLERLPWKIAGRRLRYQPSAADLQEHPGSHWRDHVESEPLVEGSEEDEERLQPRKRGPKGRNRSSTNASQSTTNSLSSRGDLFPSDEELEADAVPLDDEFATALERRNTDDRSSGKTGSGKRPITSRTSTRSVSTKSGRSVSDHNPLSTKMDSEVPEEEEITVPSLGDLKQEEERLRQEEEADVERKREIATSVAQDRGLLPDAKEHTSQADSSESTDQPEMRQDLNSPQVTTPSELQETNAEQTEENQTRSKDDADSG